MDDLKEKLSALLQDPQAMEQAMSMAASLGLGVGDGGETRRESSTLSSRQDTLVRALLPYLRPSRQARLKRALELAQLSSLAGQAMQATMAGKQQQEEVDPHV